MKILIQNYLQSQGINEDYKASILRFSTNLYKKDGEYILEFPQWFFACPKPIFTSQEIENGLKAELVEAKIDGLNSKYSGVELENKIVELNLLETLEEIEKFN